MESPANIGFPWHSAVGGTHILQRAADALRKSPCSYFDYRGLAELVTALTLHDHVVLIGPISDFEAAFVRKLQHAVGATAITIVSADAFGDAVTVSARDNLYEIVTTTLGKHAPPLRPERLNQYPERTRASEDRIPRLHEEFQEFFSTTADGLLQIKTANFAARLVQEWTTSTGMPEREYTALFVFRVFLFAALARSIRGTVIGDGIRKLVLLFLDAALSGTPLETPAYRLARMTDHVLARHQRRARRGNPGFYPVVPLTLCASITLSPSREEFLTGVGRTRDQLAMFREVVTQHGVNSDSLQERAAADAQSNRIDEYLVKTLTTLDVPEIDATSAVGRALRRSFEAFLAPQKATPDKVDVSITGSALTKVGSAVVETVQEQRILNSLRGWLELLHEVVDTQGLLLQTETWFPLTRLDAPRVRNYDGFTSPIRSEES